MGIAVNYVKLDEVQILFCRILLKCNLESQQHLVIGLKLQNQVRWSFKQLKKKLE